MTKLKPGALAKTRRKKPPPRDPRRREPELTRAALLDAATAEFARFGFDGARVERIVSDAGCNMRMLYHYFNDKENLYVEVLETVYRDIREKERQLDLANSEPSEAMLRLIRFTWDHFREHKVFIDIARNENLVGGRFIRRSSAIAKMSSPLIEMIRDTLDRGLKAKVFRRKVDPLQLYVSIVALCSHHLSNAHTLSTAFQTDLTESRWLEARRRHVEAMVMHSIGANGSG